MPQTATPPHVPASPRQNGPAPAWERHKLFQEPAYTTVLEEPAEDEEDGEW
jgi:hypothetical protein